MSVEIAQGEIERFLKEPQPEVLVIKGSWGVGKTYAWQQILSNINKDNKLSRSRYTYVSLFGVNSLDAFKYALFEQALPAKMIGESPSIDSLKDNTRGLAESVGKKALSVFRGASLLRDFAPAIESLSFLSVKNMLVCVDDLERRGDDLSIKDVLGIVSLLKEQKSCKVVLIINEEENNLEEYKKYKEKAIDVEIEFRPTAEECVDIGLDSTVPREQDIRANCVKLEINNIRLIKKIERLVRQVAPLLTNYEEEIVSQAVHSITLYSWCLYHGSSTEVPTIDYVTSRGYRLFGIGSDEKSDEEKKWDSLISSYGYQLTDELDLVFAESVRSGYFVEQEVAEKVTEKNKEVIAAKAQQSFTDAWNLFHDNLNRDQEEIVEALCTSFEKNCEHISPLNVNGTVTLLRELGEDEKADELIEIYIRRRSDTPEIFDLDSNPFVGEIRDIRLRKRFAEEHDVTHKLPGAREVLERIAGESGWGGTDEKVLSETSADEYYEIFTTEEGPHLGEYVRTCLRFGEFTNASERQLEIARRARTALERIARTSQINRIKVKKFGISVDEDA